MKTDFAIYDMDRTVTRHATYTPFLLHCAMRRAPWRLLLLPLVIASMLAYVTKLIDRGRLKEINHRLLLGHKRHPHELQPLVESFAARTVASNIRPGAHAAIASDKAEGRRVVMATARKSDRVLVSADTDFGMLLARGRGRQPSVVLLRHGVERRPDLQVRLLRDVLPRVEQVLGRGAVVAVEPLRVRVRLLPIGRGGS